MINAIQLRKGNVIILNKVFYRVEETKHITPGKGNAIIQTKIRNLTDMAIRDYRFRPVDKVEKALVEVKEHMFSYLDGDQYVFMDNESYEELRLPEDLVLPVKTYLIENETYKIEYIEGNPVSVIAPISMEFEIVETEASIKGATVQASYKPAKLSNGLEISVPPFISLGDFIKVDTRNDSYLERVKKS
jgi:elongation factor P